MSTSETTVQSWGSRLGSSFKGILVGFVLVAVAVGLLFWNEGRTIKRAQALQEGQNAVVTVDANAVDPANEGKLVCVAGDVSTDETLTDDVFNISLNAIRLERLVEIYQWEEEETTETTRDAGGAERTTTTYSYKKVWSQHLIDSSSFYESGHDNPTSKPFESESWTAQNVSLGAFRLSSNLIYQLGPSSALHPDEHETADTPTEPDATAVSPVLPSDLKPLTNGYYRGADPSSPRIGDVRITFSFVESPRQATVVSRQFGDSFVPFQAKTGEVELLENDLSTAEQMFANAHSANRTLAWLLRLVGFALTFIGFLTIFRPLVVLADVLPLAGKIVGAGTSFVSFALSVALSLTVVAVGWLFYRPLIAIPLLIGAVAAIVWLFAKTRKAPKNAD